MTRMLLLVALVALTAATASGADHWTEFRGPNGTGHSDATGLPTKWSETENIVWKTPVHGRGWSSPAVMDGRVWLTTATEDGKKMSVVALELATGKVLVDRVLFENEKPNSLNNPMNSYASPSPAVETGRVYVSFGRYGNACLDAKTGDTLWERRDVVVDHYRGPASSPVLVDGLVVIPFDGYDRQFVIALDKETGKTVWKKDRNIDYGTDNGDRKKGYGTAGVFEVDGRMQLVAPSAGATIAYDPKTGEEFWRVNHGGMNAAARPVEVDGKLVLNTAAGGFGLLAVDPTGKGDVTKTHVAWKTKRGIGTRPTPIVVDGKIYNVSDKGGAISRLDPATGEADWQDRLGGAFSSSPVYADGHLYFFDEGGKGYVVKPGDEYELVAVNELANGCMATPAVVDAGLVVRTKDAVYLVAEK